MSLLGSGADRADQRRHPWKPGAPSDEGGQFVAHMLGDTEETWTAIFQQAGPAIFPPAPRVVRQWHQHRLRLGHVGRRAFLLPARSEGVHRPRVLPAARNRIRRAGRFRQGVCHRARGRPSRAKLVRHRRQGSRGAGSAPRRPKPTRCRSGWNCRPIVIAGIWAHSADSARQLVEAGDIDEALTAASSVGDDTIQKRMQGHVNQESFTHGSGAQRQEWFRKGYSSRPRAGLQHVPVSERELRATRSHGWLPVRRRALRLLRAS